MTGRERLLAILNRRPPDRVAWTTLVDDRTRSAMPRRIREMPVLDFYRHIGCDILQFGNYGLPRDLCVPSPARLVTPPIETAWTTVAGGFTVRTQKTPWGTLVATFRNGHPIKYPVESLAELRVLKSLWEGPRYEEADVGGASVPRVSFTRADAAIGDQGLYIPTLEPSPVRQLIEMDMGMAGFYYMLQDHRDELEGLLDAMHACRMQEYEIVARRGTARPTTPGPPAPAPFAPPVPTTKAASASGASAPRNSSATVVCSRSCAASDSNGPLPTPRAEPRSRKSPAPNSSFRPTWPFSPWASPASSTAPSSSTSASKSPTAAPSRWTPIT